MVTSGEKVRLGLFLIMGIVALIGLVVVLAGLQVWESRDYYHVRYRQSVSGLEAGSQVKYNGVRVGRVEDVEIDAQDVSAVKVKFSVRGGTPIKKDSKAIVNTLGITGLRYVEIEGGSKNSVLAEPGSEIEAGESFLDELSGKATDIAIKAEKLLNNLNHVTDTENREKLKAIMANVDRLVKRVDSTLEENQENIRKVVSNVAEITDNAKGASAEIETTMVETRKGLRNTLAEADKLLITARSAIDAQGIRKGVKNANLTMQSVQDVLGEDGVKKTIGEATNLLEQMNMVLLQNREGLFDVVKYLKESAENLAEFSQLIREDPSLLLRSSPSTGE